MRVHVWGASGYAAAEAVRYLDAHPSLEIGALESRSHAGQLAGDHFPLLRRTSLRFDGEGSVVASARAGDVVLAAGGHGDARAIVDPLLARGVRIVDLSADYRFENSVAYGLTEWNRAAIADAALVANPGCYPTASLLALLPLMCFDGDLHVVIDAKSGISGAGRTPSVGALFAEVSGDVRAYGLGGHRHQPEIERHLGAYGINAKVTFTPHVVPMARGMLVDAYAIFASPIDAHEVRAAYERAYAYSSFVRLLSAEQTPSVAAVCGTNDAELRVDVDANVVRAICSIDNLGKGAAGQAIQNINVMLGLPEDCGLHGHAVAI